MTLAGRAAGKGLPRMARGRFTRHDLAPDPPPLQPAPVQHMIKPLRRTAALSFALLTASALFAPATALAAGSAYCTSTGGTATKLRAWAGTNRLPIDWVAYGGIVDACIYEAGDGSQITLWSSTLASPAPTMAALAYYAKTPYVGGGPGNPSVHYCEQLGGAWLIGNGVDGGGWAASRGGRLYGMCVFADGSAIDAWGLLYHSNDIVRGIDLSSVLRFANPY